MEGKLGGEKDQPLATDQHLIATLHAGDPAALETLYDLHAAVVFGLLARIVGDRSSAEDLLQEVFLRAWRNAASYHPERGQVRSWLLGIAHHAALNELRRRRRHPGDAPAAHNEAGTTALLGFTDPRPEPAEIAWVAERRNHIAGALAELPEEQRKVIELYATGFSQAEIAHQLAEPLGTVKSRMRRGLLHLREIAHRLGLDRD